MFSGTEGHARYVTAQFRIEHLYSKFALEWQVMLLRYDVMPSSECVNEMLNKAIFFVDSFHESLNSETVEWKSALRKLSEELSLQEKSKYENEKNL